ncbi:RNA polymerase sigma-70 factor [Actinoallomurus purpureus]|uniref:RNA polymerase sigma-70 factor n=1 Tax=Actinoallomurus purpureus TaxID=478114 RepID=UPI002091F83A|nr:RNA polymerase sigma-70 factor [Actinoallomurus purpureus]MCO6004203.1 RNA polymerase sigma-70 factor [Actinoallomurus purpureus]
MRAAKPGTDSGLDQAASVFLKLRPHLFGIAYRMLGSVAEAEDILQEVWLRWQKTDRTVVLDPPAFLARTTTRLAINVSQSARARRETYVGPWLPDPVDTSVDPAVGAERGEALELAVLLLLEKLSPTERAAYILREAFDYPYGDIADILQLSAVNTRQIVSRARKRLSAERREPVDPAEHRRLLEAFLAAARAGDVAALENLFAADAISYTDGGGIRGAARIPVAGHTRVAKFIVAFGPRVWPGAELAWVEANGSPGVLVSRDGTDVALLTIEALPQGIHTLRWVMNPVKLEAFGRSRGRAGARDVTSEGSTRS